jgi:hypothetical protein
LPPQIGWGFVSGCPAQGSANYNGMNICSDTTNNLLELQNTYAAACSAIGTMNTAGTEVGAWGTCGASAPAIFYQDIYEEVTGNGYAWSVIMGDGCGRDLDVAPANAADPGALRLFACSGSNMIAYGTQEFNLGRSGNMWLGGTLAMGGLTSTESGTKADIVGSVAVGAENMGGRYLDITGAFNVLDPGAINTSMVKTGVVTIQWAIAGSSSVDTARALQLIDHDHSSTVVMSSYMNGSEMVGFKALSDLSYGYSQPTAGGMVVIGDSADLAIIDPSSTLATLTVNLPTCSSLYDGKLASFSSSHIITALTVGATAGSIVGAPSTLTVGGGAKFICRGANATWFRVL